MTKLKDFFNKIANNNRIYTAEDMEKCLVMNFHKTKKP